MPSRKEAKSLLKTPGDLTRWLKKAGHPHPEHVPPPEEYPCVADLIKIANCSRCGIVWVEFYVYLKDFGGVN